MKATIRGVEYALSKMKTLPKKGIGDVVVTVDGKEYSARVTSNAAWCGGKDFLEYIWIEVDGVAYYVTLDYNVTAATFAGAEISVAPGAASRKNPVRGPKALEGPAFVEATRIEKFKATWAKNRLTA